jgi:hypothetical protein
MEPYEVDRSLKSCEVDRSSVEPYEVDRNSVDPYEVDRSSTEPYEVDRSVKPCEVDRSSVEPYAVDCGSVEPAIGVLFCTVRIAFTVAVCRHHPHYTLSKSGDKNINHKICT